MVLSPPWSSSSEYLREGDWVINKEKMPLLMSLCSANNWCQEIGETKPQ